jgi:YgiT-type zinc finger domain-containing protein
MKTQLNYIKIKCDFCKTGVVKPIKSLEKLYYEGRVYIFENVPVGVCNNCGERYIHAKVLNEMEKDVDRKESKELVSLYEFQEEMVEL